MDKFLGVRSHSKSNPAAEDISNRRFGYEGDLSRYGKGINQMDNAYPELESGYELV